MTKESSYDLLHGHLWFGLFPQGSPLLLQIKIKGGEGEKNPFQAGKKKKKIWQCQACSPLHLNLFEGQAVLGVVTLDSNKFLTFETAGGFAEDEALVLRASLL